MEIGDSIKVGDLDLPEDVQVNTAEEEVIVLITVPELPEEEEEEVEGAVEDIELVSEDAEEVAEDHVDAGGHETNSRSRGKA